MMFNSQTDQDGQEDENEEPGDDLKTPTEVLDFGSPDTFHQDISQSFSLSNVGYNLSCPPVPYTNAPSPSPAVSRWPTAYPLLSASISSAEGARTVKMQELLSLGVEQRL